jgi:4'-phosphopantetheinyl transferase
MSDNEPVWTRLSGAYVLPKDEVHVWRTSLDMSRSGIAKLREFLSAEERERADRFHHEVDGRRCVIGRGLLRLLLGSILELPADQLRFEYHQFGKPNLIAAQGFPLQFNVSHAGELILVAVTAGRAVGVDVERIRTDLAIGSLAAQLFSAEEYKGFASLKGHMQCEAFFAYWTRREAYLKARGVGLSSPFDQFSVSFLPGEEPRLLKTRPDPTEALRWTLRTLDLGRDYVAALAVAGLGWKLRCLDWQPSDR